MSYEERIIFLSKIRNEVEKDETLFSEIINVCQAGINSKIKQLKEQAMDMETIAIAFSTGFNEKYKKSNQEWINGILLAKIKKYDTTTAFFAWRTTLDKMENTKGDLK